MFSLRCFLGFHNKTIIAKSKMREPSQVQKYVYKCERCGKYKLENPLMVSDWIDYMPHVISKNWEFL